MSRQNISIGYGKATFPDTSITLTGFVVEAPFVRTLASKKLPKIGSTMRQPVTDHPEIDGWLFTDSIDVPDGAILLVQASRKFRGSGLYDGCMFIRARKDGAGLLITANIPPHARCTLTNHNFPVFSGNGDILTIEDLDAEGITPSGNYVSAFMDEEEVAEAYEVHIIAAAKSAKPKVEKIINDAGEEVRLNVSNPQRRMRIRRG